MKSEQFNRGKSINHKGVLAEREMAKAKKETCCVLNFFLGRDLSRIWWSEDDNNSRENE